MRFLRRCRGDACVARRRLIRTVAVSMRANICTGGRRKTSPCARYRPAKPNPHQDERLPGNEYPDGRDRIAHRNQDRPAVLPPSTGKPSSRMRTLTLSAIGRPSGPWTSSGCGGACSLRTSRSRNTSGGRPRASTAHSAALPRTSTRRTGNGCSRTTRGGPTGSPARRPDEPDHEIDIDHEPGPASPGRRARRAPRPSLRRRRRSAP